MKKPIDRNLLIFISFVFGMIIGFRLLAGKLTLMIDSETILSVFGVVGISYVYLFRLLIIPITLVSVMCGVFKMQELKNSGPIGKRTLRLYMVTTMIAILMTLFVIIVLKPGMTISGDSVNFGFVSTDLPTNVYRFLILLQDKLMLKLIERKAEYLVISGMFLGLVLSYMKNDKIKKHFDTINFRLLQVADLTWLITPLGVLSIVTVMFSFHGYEILFPLIKYFFVVLLIYGIQILFVYPTLLVFSAHLNPIIFLKKFRTALKVAVRTSSSNATLPVTMDMLENQFGVSQELSRKTLPVGATINMDGSAILYGSATVFLAQLYGITLDPVTLVGIFLFSAITSVATSGVPYIGVFMLGIVLDYVGIPLEGLFIIVGMERVLDMVSTLVNVAGDAVCTLIVAQEEEEIDLEIYSYL